MPFLPLFIVIGIFLATSKILEPSQHQQPRSSAGAYEDFEDNALSLALIDYISRESRSKTDSDHEHKSSSRSGKRRAQETHRR